MTLSKEIDFERTQEIISMGKEVLHLEADTITNLADNLSPVFAQSVELLLSNTGRVAITGMGKSGHIARKIAATLASTGTPAFFIHPAEASHGDLGMMTTGDVLIAISNSGNTLELSDILHFATRYGIRIIAITRSKESKLGALADLCLELPHTHEACPLGCAPTSSTTATLALGDAIAMALLRLRGFTAQEFNIYHPGGALGNKLMTVGDVMRVGEALPLVHENMMMHEVIYVMTGKGFGCAGVLNDTGKLIGIITDGDLRRHMSTELMSKTAHTVMTPQPLVVMQDCLTSKARHIMEQKKITSLFVVRDFNDLEPIGVVTIHTLRG
ncbi:MAG: KpsF/GutQ family sugar-phosphate isomerase [Pseudomonadota bacterium]